MKVEKHNTELYKKYVEQRSGLLEITVRDKVQRDYGQISGPRDGEKEFR